MHGAGPSIPWIALTALPEAGRQTAWHVAFPSAWPAWVTVLAVAAAVGLFVGLYRREGRHVSRARRTLLTGLRIGAFGLALAVLFEPVLVVDRLNLRSSHVGVLVDVSLSMSVADRYDKPEAQEAIDAVLAGRRDERKPRPSGEPARATRLELAQALLTGRDGRLLRRLLERHKVSVYAAGAGPGRFVARLNSPEDLPEALQRIRELTATADQTRLGEAMRTALNDLRGQVVPAALLLSDGQNNAGPTLDEAAVQARQRGTRIFGIGLGNPAPARDLALRQLLVDDVVFVDDAVAFRADLVAQGYEGRPVTVELKADEEPAVLAAATVRAGPDGQPVPVQVNYRPTREGKRLFHLQAVAQPDEARSENNRVSQAVRVVREPVRVLYVEGYPRYEYRYLKNLLVRDKTIDVSCLLLDADAEFPQEGDTPIRFFPTSRDDLEAYAVVIFGDVNPVLMTGDQLDLVARFTEEGGGFLMIAGPYWAPMEYRDTPISRILPVELETLPRLGEHAPGEFRPELTPEGQSSPIVQFAETREDSLAIWNRLPGLFWFCPVRRAKPAATVLAVHPHAVGAEGRLPIFVTQFVGAGRSLFHAVDETWRWRWRVGDAYFGKFWIQAIRFLARTRLLGKTRMVDILTDRARYALGETVRVEVRFLNRALEPAERGQVTVSVESKAHGRRELILRPGAGGRGVYEGFFVPPGAGEFRLQPQLAGRRGEVPSAEFDVRPAQVEFEDVRLNELGLEALAEATDGAFYSAVPGPDGRGLNHIDEIPDRIPGGPQITVSTSTYRLWDTWAALLAFVGLLVVEWVLRKRSAML